MRLLLREWLTSEVGPFARVAYLTPTTRLVSSYYNYVSSYYYMCPHTTIHVTRDLLLSVVYEQPSSSTTTPSEASISCIASSDTSV
jgi:hypothetical protein